MDRRRFLTRVVPVGVLGALSACSGRPVVPPRAPHAAPADRAASAALPPVALVYRGPASGPGCSEAVAALLAGTTTRLRVVYCGPGERVPLSARALATATVYAQPGGGELDPAWQLMGAHAGDIRTWVSRGGRYLGFCLGGYLAGATPGFGLLPGDTDQYLASPGATVRTTDDTIVAVRWRGHLRHLFFQDGPQFRLDHEAAPTVLATYPNGAIAAAVTRHGAGRVGVVGPHPEADRSWYADAGLTNPDGVRADLGRDLVETTLGR
jgi:hypothetical protein